MTEEILPELVLVVESQGVPMQDGDTEPLSARAVVFPPACPRVVPSQPGLLPALPDHVVPLAGQLVEVPGGQAKHCVQDILVSEVENFSVPANKQQFSLESLFYRTFR